MIGDDIGDDDDGDDVGDEDDDDDDIGDDVVDDVGDTSNSFSILGVSMVSVSIIIQGISVDMLKIC
jgi:hypothetical protein